MRGHAPKWLAHHETSTITTAHTSKYNSTLTYPQVWVSVANEIAYVHSDFYNGAASTAQCERLTAAIREAARISGSNDGGVKAVLLMGGEHSYGNGINLNTIEASEDPEMVRRGGGSKGSILRYSTHTSMYPMLAAVSQTERSAPIFAWRLQLPSFAP